MVDFALWFGGRVFFPAMRWDRPDWFALVVGLAALAILIRWKISVPLLLAACALLGVAYRFTGFGG